ncbi:hypothetical protein RFI_36717, partial [Reticulomyxa filosa]
QFNVPSDDLFVCDVWKNKIHRDLKNRDMIAEINRRNDDIVVYYVPKPSASDDKISASSSNSEQKKNQSDTKDNNNNNNNNNNNSTSNGNNESNNSNATASTTNTTNNNNNSNNQNRQQISPELKTFQIFCQTRVKIRTTSFFYSAQYREEDELIGLPLLLTLPLTRDVSFKEVRQKILDLIRPFLTSKERLKLTKEKQLPFVIYALYGNNT